MIKTIDASEAGLAHFEVDAEADAGQADVFALSSHARAIEALVLGLERPGPHYNIYVLGPDQSGRLTATREHVQTWATAYPTAPDWLYLFDFAAPNTPQPVPVPAGMGNDVTVALARLIPRLAEAIAGAFSSEAYQQQIAGLRQRAEASVQARSQALEASAREHGLTLLQTPQGPIVAALGENNEPVAIQSLPADERERLLAASATITNSLAEIHRDALRAQQRVFEAAQALGVEVAGRATSGLVQSVAQAFESIDALSAWFRALEADVVENYPLFLDPQQPVPTPEASRATLRYAVNLMVDRRGETHRPVVLEQNPTYENLFGKIEYRQMPGGGLDTDVSLIRAGSLHRANGGVLLVRATDMAAQPGVWNYLKAALRDGEIRIEEFYRAGSPPVAGAPRPTPVPLDLTVVLIGPPALYHFFFAADPEFSNYFKIKAQIEPVLDATPANLGTYAGLLRRFAHSRGATIERAALQRLLGMASRWAAHRGRLTTRYEAVNNLIEEACADCEVIDVSEVNNAISARRRRNALVEDEVHRAIRDELTIISVSGTATGQINGLTVQDVGDHTFGAPARITARASVGRRGVINIERQVAMSGPIQQKGSMTLQGLLMRRFARHAPLSFDCSVTFEQLYGGVEGDSASLAEYVAIVSDLADLPIRQDLAITGSVNQLGEAQVIGGLHHKVEGFFRVCTEEGALTGTQGVIFPRGNEQHLVLRDEVVEAMAANQFHLYSIETVDEAVELLTGMPVGTSDSTDPDTVYGRVVAALHQFDEVLSKRGL